MQCGSDKLCYPLGGQPCSQVPVDARPDAPDAPPDALPGCVLQIAAYHRTSCALRADHTVWCWGDNTQGLLGNGALGGSSGQPTQVTGLSNATAVVLGKNMAYALLSSGDVVAWGTNVQGALCDGTNNNHLTPNATMLHNIVELVAGNSFVCARDTSNNISCCGQDNYGQLGDGSNMDSNTPESVTQGLALAATGAHTCMIDLNGHEQCWGRNNWDTTTSGGALGDGTTTNSNAPVMVQGPFPALQITEAGHTSCAVKTDHTVWCWGQNKFGELGDGTETEEHVPQQVPGVTNAVAVYGAGHRVCARLMSGGVVCWGEEPIAQRTVLTNTVDMPKQDIALTATRAFATGSYHTCAIALDGTIECMGRDVENQLGPGTNNDSTTFVPVPLACQ